MKKLALYDVVALSVLRYLLVSPSLNSQEYGKWN